MIFNNNKQLEDKGWAQMNALLDKEMPRSRKRRPILWWWAAASIIGFGAISGIVNYYSGRNTPAPDTDAYSAPTATEILSTTHSNGSVLGENASSTIAAAGVSAETATQRNVHARSSFSAKNIPPIYVQPLELSTDGMANFSSQTDDLSSKALALLDGDYPYHVHTQRAHKDIQIAPVAYDPVIKKAPRLPLRSRLELGLMAGANALQVKQVPGFIGGFTLDYFSKTKRGGLQTGLVYRYQMFSGESRPVIPVSYDRYLAATGNDEITPENLPGAWVYISKSNRVLIPVMKSHQLEIPVMLFWQPSPRFRVYGGTTFMRHIWIESAGKGLFTYDLKVVTTPDADAAGNLNTVIKDQLPAWENAWQTGIGFKPFKHIEIGLYYRSAWYGKPSLSDVKSLFDNCTTCSAKYPAAARQTRQSVRPQSAQLNISYKF